MLKKYKHIIWDWNGTIFNDVELGVGIINQLLLERNLKTVTVEEYKNIFTIPVKNYYSSLGFNFDKESFEIVGKMWMDEYEKRKFECTVADGITETLEKIQSYGIGQSILSAYSQHTLEEMVNHFNLTKYFTHIIGLDNIYAASKLHLGQKLIKMLKNGKGETLMIGDTEHDYEVAVEMGSDCILLANGHYDKTRLLKTNCIVLNNILELLEL